MTLRWQIQGPSCPLTPLMRLFGSVHRTLVSVEVHEGNYLLRFSGPLQTFLGGLTHDPQLICCPLGQWPLTVEQTNV